MYCTVLAYRYKCTVHKNQHENKEHTSNSVNMVPNIFVIFIYLRILNYVLKKLKLLKRTESSCDTDTVPIVVTQIFMCVRT